MASSICQKCGEKISGLKYFLDGKNYCFSCFQDLAKKKTVLENQKKALYSHIKDIFGINELPSDVIIGLDRNFASGQSFDQMELTLHYFYDVTKHDPTSVSMVPFILKSENGNAIKYKVYVDEVKKKNAKISLDVSPVVVEMSSEDLGRPKKNFKNKIEDL